VKGGKLSHTSGLKGRVPFIDREAVR
jgi:hypothetical protein